MTSTPLAAAESIVAKVVLARSARDALAKLDYLRADAILDALSELERTPKLVTNCVDA